MFGWFIIFGRFYSVPQHSGIFSTTWKAGNSSVLYWCIDIPIVYHESSHLLRNDIYIYIYIYRRYHTITDVYTTALLLTKPSNDDSGPRHGFGAEASLLLAQRAPAVSHDTTRLGQIVVTLWDCQIHADAVKALSWIFSMYFILSDGGSPRLIQKTEVELAIKPLHPTLIGNTFVIQPFLTHCSRRSSYFSNLRWYAQSKFSS